MYRGVSGVSGVSPRYSDTGDTLRYRKKINMMKNIEYNYKGLVDEVVSRGISLADTYDEWTKCAFALSELGEEGRELFYAVASISPKYRQAESERKFNNAENTASSIGVASFIYMCQQAGIDTQKYIGKDSSHTYIYKVKEQPKKIEPDYLPRSAFALDSGNSLVCYLCDYFTLDELEGVLCDYRIGSYHDTTDNTTDGVIFPYIDEAGNYRSGKIMHYFANGHRRKDMFNSVQNLMKKQGLLPADSHFTECLFGEHLFREYPDKKVGIVESEKTAIIASLLIPSFVWAATGGKGKISKSHGLEGREIVLFPDADGIEAWQKWAKELAGKCKVKVKVSSICEGKGKEDIADLLMKERLPLPPEDRALTWQVAMYQ